MPAINTICLWVCSTGVWSPSISSYQNIPRNLAKTSFGWSILEPPTTHNVHTGLPGLLTCGHFLEEVFQKTREAGVFLRFKGYLKFGRGGKFSPLFKWICSDIAITKPPVDRCSLSSSHGWGPASPASGDSSSQVNLDQHGTWWAAPWYQAAKWFFIWFS